MRSVTWHRILLKFADEFKLFTCVVTSYLNRDMRKIESSQKD